MTPQEKIKYVRNTINDKVQISPKGLVHLNLYTLVEYEEGPTLISRGEQKSIIKKLEEDGYVKNVKFDDDGSGIWLEKVEFPKTSIDYIREVVLELHNQYQQYPVGGNIRYEIYVGRTDDDDDEILEERYGRLNAIKQLEAEGVIEKYELEHQQYIFEVAKCIINKEKLLEHARILNSQKFLFDETEENAIEKIQDEEIPEIKLDFEETSNTPLIRSKTLQLIASEIGEFETGENLKHFLIDCGVDENLIEYPQTKWRMVHSVLVALSQSKNSNDHKALFKIIEESVHPLMHRGDKDKSLEIQDNFTSYLQYDGYNFSNGHIVKADDKIIKDAESRRNRREMSKKEDRLNEGLGGLFHDFMTESPNKKPPTQKPIPIQIVGGKMEVEGLRGGLEAIAKTKIEDGKPKFPFKLPRGTKWKNITIKFIDDDNVKITAKGKEHAENYKGMDFAGKKDASVLWLFLKILAKYYGEIVSSDPDANNKFKKQKELLSEKLENYFGLDYTDPFYPFQVEGKSERSYRTKFQLIPPDDGFSFEKKTTKAPPKTEKKNPFEDLQDFMNEEAPIITQIEKTEDGEITG